ncbi:peptide ABC transporter permease [Bacterioplanes sanyensis]|uniref:ABC transporter permease n=1 Tax=Bacterioplanes sanyensis TaxID=1249553 RepID=UPI001671ADFC|nr:ABC transporter permease [Bacterioplanes sanyensis]GGY33426.1 peptide ABC transporter permease [Bacterioplanes sanyensis]
MIKPVILWSDVLIYLLVISVVAFLIQLRKRPQTRERWRSVFTSKVGMVSFVVIAFYVLVALLDSLHYREALPPSGEGEQTTAYSSEVKSVLDVVLHNLHESNEKTYSAPFAIYSFAKENLEADDGSIYRDYPRLEHAGKHLDDPSERTGDILWRTLVALMTGLLIAAVLIGLHKYVLRGSDGDNGIPWKAAYITIAILSMFTCWVIQLSEFYHVMGTNKVGADVMYSSIKAIRTGVLIGTLATMVTLPFAIILGISAGYFKGLVDDIVQYLYTTLSSIPSILLIAASVLLVDVYIETNAEEFNLTILRSDFKFLALCAILGLTSWTTLCRLLRAETLKVSQLEYVQAAHAFGVSHGNIISRHILPNITHIILIALVLDFSMFVLAEALLSYIGVGVDPSMHSWGNMINAARSELSRDPFVWWPVISAFLLMFTLVLAANLFSDEVRNAFDPRTVKEGN